ncbi:hypothetical protein D3C71_1201950 [compost metagenome]
MLVETQVIERLFAIDPLVRQGQPMGAEPVSGGKRPGGVVDPAGQAVAVIVGAVEIEIQVQRLVWRQHIGVIDVAVVLPPDVGELRTVQADTQLIAQRIAAAQVIDAAGFHPGVQRFKGAIGIGRIIVVAGSEVANVQLQCLELIAGQLEAGGTAGEQSRIAGAEHRIERCQVAVLELGLRNPRLQRTTGFGVLILGTAIGIDRQQPCARAPLATVELDAQLRVGIDPETHRSLGVAGAVVEDDPVGPLVPIVLTARVVEVVAVEIEVAIGQCQAAVFDKSVVRGGTGHLAKATGDGERQGRPEGQFHSACSLLL